MYEMRNELSGYREVLLGLRFSADFISDPATATDDSDTALCTAADPGAAIRAAAYSGGVPATLSAALPGTADARPGSERFLLRNSAGKKK